MRGILIALVLAGTLAGAFVWFDGPARFGWTQAVDDRLSLYGNVDIRQVQLGFRSPGRLAETLVDEGDHVEAGQVIARLTRDTFEQAVTQAEAEVAARQAAHSKVQAGPRPEEIAQARAILEERTADLGNATQAYERAATLRSTGSASAASLDQATAARDMAAARRNSAREALALIEEGSRSEDIAAARAELAAAQAALASARTALADTELRAPSEGIVLSRVREAGAIVSPSDIVYAIALSEPMWIRSYVSEPNLGKLAPGMRVEIFTDGAPDRPYSGTVGFISPVAEFTPKTVETPELRTDLVYRFRVVVDKGSDGLRQGMPVTIRLPQGGGR